METIYSFQIAGKTILGIVFVMGDMIRRYTKKESLLFLVNEMDPVRFVS